MAFMLRWLIGIILIVGLVRFVLARIMGMAKAPGSNQKISNNMVKDPVCGMYMDSRLAVRLENRKDAQFFCSEECKNKYLGQSADSRTSGAPPV